MTKPTLSVAVAGHPFRRTLAPRAVTVVVHRDDQDLKLFVLSFTAFFICFATMVF